jgi:exopolyphosphatase/guanosine-5'-triphosphate,3'-diphosphate pyrophosphatase
MRVAALDLGTNTTRLLVADVHDGRVEDVERQVRITRLGEGVDARGRLLPVPIARVRNCLTEFRRDLESLEAERILAVATSAIRDADNGEAFLGEVEWSYGFKTRLLTGAEEALLTFRGATLGRSLEKPTLVVDLGGGSTELIVGSESNSLLQSGWHASLDVGSVRLTERFLPSDPPTVVELNECAGAVRSLLAERVPEDVGAEAAIGVAGTITTLAALAQSLPEYDPERVHGYRLSLDGITAQLERLTGMALAERRNLPALEPERAPVIVAGAVILWEVLAYVGLNEIEASERDLLHGAALEAANLPETVEGDAPPGAYTCC